jgi:hypothetical protein
METQNRDTSDDIRPRYPTIHPTICPNTLNDVRPNTLNGVHSNTLNDVHSNTLNGVHSNTLNGVHSNTLNGVHSNTLNDVRPNTLNGVHSNTSNDVRLDTLSLEKLFELLLSKIREYRNMQDNLGRYAMDLFVKETVPIICYRINVLFKKILDQSPKSELAHLFGCEIRKNSNGQEIYYSTWYSNPSYKNHKKISIAQKTAKCSHILENILVDFNTFKVSLPKINDHLASETLKEFEELINQLETLRYNFRCLETQTVNIQESYLNVARRNIMEKPQRTYQTSSGEDQFVRVPMFTIVDGEIMIREILMRRADLQQIPLYSP